MHEMIFKIALGLDEMSRENNIPCTFVVNESINAHMPIRDNELVFSFVGPNGETLNSARLYYNVDEPELIPDHIKRLNHYFDTVLAMGIPAKLEIYKPK